MLYTISKHAIKIQPSKKILEHVRAHACAHTCAHTCTRLSRQRPCLEGNLGNQDRWLPLGPEMADLFFRISLVPRT